jgi:hypothetical protein
MLRRSPLCSTNGITVNGNQVGRGEKWVLHNGDLLSIAQRAYRIQYNETGRASDLAEDDEELEDTLSIPLLEKANLLHPPRHKRPRRSDPDD